MNSVADLLFELTNEDRLAILGVLNNTPATLTEIYRELELKPPETSRHLTRLAEGGLIEKTPGGAYEISSVGMASISLLSGFSFLEENMSYFNEHSLKQIPESLLLRIGELDGAMFLDDVMSSIYESEKIVGETEGFIYCFTDQIPMNILPRLEQMKATDIEFHVIFPNNMSPHKEYVNKESYHKVKNRYRDSIPAYMAVNEKRAIVGFNYKDGRVDHRVFQVNHEAGRIWCEDLFKYFWERTSTEIPEFYSQYTP